MQALTQIQNRDHAQAYAGARAVAVAAAAPSVLFALFAVVFLRIEGAPIWLHDFAAISAIPAAALIVFEFHAAAPTPIRFTAAVTGLIAATVSSWASSGLASPLTPWLIAIPVTACLTLSRAGRLAICGVALGAFALLAFLPASRAALSMPAELTAWLDLGWRDFAAPQRAHLWFVAALAGVGLTTFIAITLHLEWNRLRERRLIESADLNSILVEAGGLAILRLSPERHIQSVGGAITALTGFPPDALTGTPINEFIHRDDLSTIDTYLDARGALAEMLRLRLRTARGGYVWAEAVRVFRSEASGPALILRPRWTIDDCASHGADETDQARAAFLAHMSHELRTPLNAIVGFSDILMNELFGPLGTERYRDYAKLVHESGLHMLDLVDELLDMTKIEGGQFKPVIEDVQLDPLLQGCLRVTSVRAALNRSKLKLDLRTPGAVLRTDRRALRQIMINLLCNAMNNSAPNSKITVTARIEREDAQIAVETSCAGNFNLDKTSDPAEGAREAFFHLRDAYLSHQSEARLGILVAQNLTQILGGRLAALSSENGVDRLGVALLLPAAVSSGDAQSIAPALAGQQQRNESRTEPTASGSQARESAA